MTQITIGQSEQEEITIDLQKLIETRLLIQANSGGYSNNLSSLRTMGAIEYLATARLVATKNLFIKEKQ